MPRRPTGALTRHPPADRAHLTLIKPEPLPEAAVNAARIDPSVLDEVGTSAAPAPRVGVLERRDNFPCAGRVTYNYEDEAGRYYIASVPDFGADPALEDELLRLMGAIQARARQQVTG